MMEDINIKGKQSLLFMKNILILNRKEKFGSTGV
jgi:hypothetical protein